MPHCSCHSRGLATCHFHTEKDDKHRARFFRSGRTGACTERMHTSYLASLPYGYEVVIAYPTLPSNGLFASFSCLLLDTCYIDSDQIFVDRGIHLRTYILLVGLTLEPRDALFPRFQDLVTLPEYGISPFEVLTAYSVSLFLTAGRKADVVNFSLLVLTDEVVKIRVPRGNYLASFVIIFWYSPLSPELIISCRAHQVRGSRYQAYSRKGMRREC